MIKLYRDFPILKRKVNGLPLTYLDNGATTQKPNQVIKAVTDFYKQHNANINRGVHTLAEESTQAYEDARDTVADFLKVDSNEIIFTRNTTESLNLIAYAWGLKNLHRDDEIILSIMEHHSNIVPWQIIAKHTGAVIKYINIDNNGELILIGDNSLKSLLSNKTKIVSLTHVSNTLGTINPIEDIAKQIKQFNQDILVIVDGAQSAPHLPVNLSKTKIDFFTFSGHKMLGPMGIGVLWGRKQLLDSMSPFMAGGDMISEVYLDNTIYNKVPEKFEAGTPNVVGAVGLAKACKYLQDIGMQNIYQHELKLINYLYYQLTTKFPNIKILGPKDLSKRSSLISFIHPTIHAHDMAEIFNSIGIAVRSGHHCTMPLHNHLNISASTRISVYLYNTLADMDKVVLGIKKAETIFS